MKWLGPLLAMKKQIIDKIKATENKVKGRRISIIIRCTTEKQEEK